MSSHTGAWAPYVRDRLDARILVVDDDAGNVLLLERILQRAGYRDVRSLTDPRAVDGALTASRPDILLLDLAMPHVDGYAVLGRVRREWPDPIDLPVVVLTADASVDAKRRSLEAGATDFLTKPLDQIEVTIRIQNLLDAHLYRAALVRHSQGLEEAVRERTADLRRMIDDLRRVDSQRRRLLQSLVDAQEGERRAIASDIHDDSIQKMTAVGLRLEVLRMRLTDEDQRKEVAAASDIVATSIARLRRLLFELRPPALDRDGLGPALAEYLHALESDSGLSTVLHNELTSDPPPDIRTIVYRVAQEAVTNVRKHARASTVSVRLRHQEAGVHLCVEDDGVGIAEADVASEPVGHLGLTTMRERAELAGGWCRVGRLPHGTAVEMWVPTG